MVSVLGSASRDADTKGWTKYSRCSSGLCVEICRRPDLDEVLIRDSKQNRLGDTQPIIRLSTCQFDYLLSCISAAEVVNERYVSINRDVRGGWCITCHRSGTVLAFDDDEMQAFRLGVAAGEFGPLLVS